MSTALFEKITEVDYTSTELFADERLCEYTVFRFRSPDGIEVYLGKMGLGQEEGYETLLSNEWTRSTERRWEPVAITASQIVLAKAATCFARN